MSYSVSLKFCRNGASLGVFILPVEEPSESVGESVDERARVSFDATLVEKPKVYALIAQQLPDQLYEELPLFFILTIELGTGDFQPKTFVVKPTEKRAVLFIRNVSFTRHAIRKSHLDQKVAFFWLLFSRITI